MAGLPTNQRDQAMLLVGILGILAAGAYWYLVYTPKSDELGTLRTQVERLDASNQRAKALLARGTVEELRAEAELLQDNLDLMRTLIPAGNEVPALLDQIVGAARRTGLEQQSFVPGATVQGEVFDTYRYRMAFSGNYHQIGELLTAIGSLRRIIAPVNLSLTPSTAARAANAPPGEQLLSVNFDIQTYVLRAAPPAEGETP
jgi:type IV pilus assembly protein PilO